MISEEEGYGSPGPQEGFPPMQRIKLLVPFLLFGLACDFHPTDKKGLGPNTAAREVERQKATPEGAATPEEDATLKEGEKNIPIGNSPVRGGKDALVTIVMFSDLQCPYCDLGRKSLGEVYEKYKDEVRIVWKNLPLMEIHPNALPAAQAAMAAAKQSHEVFWAFTDNLFDNMREYSGRGAPQMQPVDFERFLPESAGFDRAKWREEASRPELAKEIFADVKLATQIDARATPTFFINGRKIEGALPLEAFSQVIDAELAVGKELLAKGMTPKEIYKARIEKNLITADTRFQVAADGPSRGAEEPKVTIVAFSEFQCPACLVGDEVIVELIKNYPEDVRIVYRNLPLVEIHPDALLAAEAALAANEQGKYLAYHDKLFQNQRVPDPENPGRAKSGLTPPDLERYAKEVGLDLARFRAALEDHRFQEKIIKDVRDAIALGVQGTPAYFVNGKILRGALPYEEFEKLIKEEIKFADELLAKGVARKNLYQEIIKDGYVP